MRDANTWAMILGASSGMGLATAKKLASHGMNIFAIHRDRRAAMAAVDRYFAEIRSYGVQCVNWNLNAVDPACRSRVIDGLREHLGEKGRIRLLLHSIAWGSLRPLAPVTNASASEAGEEILLDEDNLSHTFVAMAASLLPWVQDLHRNAFFSEEARVIALTSEGSTVAWHGYAAVGMAKAAMESLCRSIAVEYGPLGLRTNVIQAGVTDTPALRAVPACRELMGVARAKNPLGRLTTTADVASVVYLLCLDDAAWVNGAVIRVDGGEYVASARGKS